MFLLNCHGNFNLSTDVSENIAELPTALLRNDFESRKFARNCVQLRMEITLKGEICRQNNCVGTKLV
jgi:hypothetical protein